MQATAAENEAQMEERLVTEAVRVPVAECAAQRSFLEIRHAAGSVRGLEGRFRSGFTDLAEAHDQHLDDAFDC